MAKVKVKKKSISARVLKANGNALTVPVELHMSTTYAGDEVLTALHIETDSMRVMRIELTAAQLGSLIARAGAAVKVDAEMYASNREFLKLKRVTKVVDIPKGDTFKLAEKEVVAYCKKHYPDWEVFSDGTSSQQNTPKVHRVVLVRFEDSPKSNPEFDDDIPF